MLNIIHQPNLSTEKVIAHYTEKDGVPIKYVCTTSPGMGNVAGDIFYRDTPHPEFGNHYFSLYTDYNGRLMISGADIVETLDFDMIEVDGELHYSQHRHHFNSVKGIAIDGGRAYTKLVGDVSNAIVHRLRIKDGEFVKNEG